MPITFEQLAEWKALRAKAAEGPWVANHYDWDADDSVSDDLTGTGPSDRIWTLSTNPAREGWETDSGQPNYGMAQDDALYAASAMNAAPALIAEVERLQQALIIAGHREDTLSRDLTPEEMRGISADRRGREPWKED